MTHDGESLDAQGVENGLGIESKLMKGELVAVWFVGLAEANLVRQDDPVALVEHDLGCGIPRLTAEIFTVQHHYDLLVAAGLFRGDIHVGLT